MNVILNRVGLLLLVGVGLMFVREHWAHFTGFILLFSVFDVYGYKKVGKFVNGDEEGIAEYRIIQLMFQVLFIYYLVLSDGWLTAACAVFAWWLLACDLLYYFILNEKLTPFTWFKTSPVVFIHNVLLKEPAPVGAVLVSAIVGFLAGLSLTILQ